MPNGFLALFDVLGFSSLVLAGDERLGKYLGAVRDTFGSRSGIEYVVFSDTVVLTTADDSETAFQTLLQHSSALFGGLLEQDIALRGAISCGPFIREETPGGVFVAGRAVIEAHSFETKQDWVGIMVAPSTVRRFPDFGARCEIYPPGSTPSTEEGRALLMKQCPWSGFVQRCPNIPFHSADVFDSSSFDGFAVTPSSGIATPAALAASLDKSLMKLAFLRSVAPDPAAQQKYKKASEWIDRIQRAWKEIGNQMERFTGQQKTV